MQLSTDLPPAVPAMAARMLDTSDFCLIVDHALSERAAGLGALPDLLGLPGPQIAALRDRWFPYADLPDLDVPLTPIPEDQKAITTLIHFRGGSGAPEARWLAAILARRAQEPHHLWEDLGLANRPSLSELIGRHLPGLKAANSQNMRWKKFLYRQICSTEGFQICLSPTCGECPEREDCFAPD